jgi:hypothetical protein
LLPSCATIINGTDQDVYISSTPDSASVTISTFYGVKIQKGVTPLTVNLKREDEYKVLVSKEGYEDNEVVIRNSANGAVWGNILCGGIIGLIIDFSNGAAYELEPETLHVDLIEVKDTSSRTEYYLLIKMANENGEVQTIVKPFQKKQRI